MSIYKITKTTPGHLEIKIVTQLTFNSIGNRLQIEDINKLSGKKATELTIDCSEINRIDSSGLALLIHMKKSIPRIKTKLKCPPKNLKKLQSLYLTPNELL